ILQYGWPSVPAAGGGGGDQQQLEISDWLDEAFKGDWHRKLVEASKKPIGVVDDPKLLNLDTALRSLDGLRVAGTLLAVRGLQLQAERDDPATFVSYLDAGLTLVRNMQNTSPSITALTGWSIEGEFLRALDHWLAGLGHRRDLLRKALDVVEKHRAGLPTHF